MIKRIPIGYNAYGEAMCASIIKEMQLGISEECQKHKDTDKEYEVMQSILAKEFK